MAGIFAVAYNEASRRQEALQLTEKIVEARKTTLSEEHPDILRQPHDLRTLESKLGSGQCRFWRNLSGSEIFRLIYILKMYSSLSVTANSLKL